MILLVRDIDLNSVRSTVRVTGNHRDLQTFVLPRDFQPNKTLLDTIASRLAGIETVHFMKTLVRPFCAVLFVIVKIRDRMSRSERFQLKSISSSKCWFVHDDFQLRINTYTEDFIHVKDLLFFFQNNRLRETNKSTIQSIYRFTTSKFFSLAFVPRNINT